MCTSSVSGGKSLRQSRTPVPDAALAGDHRERGAMAARAVPVLEARHAAGLRPLDAAGQRPRRDRPVVAGPERVGRMSAPVGELDEDAVLELEPRRPPRPCRVPSQRRTIGSTGKSAIVSGAFSTLDEHQRRALDLVDLGQHARLAAQHPPCVGDLDELLRAEADAWRRARCADTRAAPVFFAGSASRLGATSSSRAMTLPFSRDQKVRAARVPSWISTR